MTKKIINRVIHRIIRPKGKNSFLIKNAKNKSILDVGSGQTPKKLTALFNSLNYQGIDIKNHLSNGENFIGKYNVLSIDKFWNFIKESANKYDVVIFSHVIEHIPNRYESLEMVARCVKEGGYFYLSFPSPRSITLPSKGIYTLNYFDDQTHLDLPPDLSVCLDSLMKNNFKDFRVYESYRPILSKIIGFMLIKFQLHKIFGKKASYFLLAYYGFETVVICQKNN